MNAETPQAIQHVFVREVVTLPVRSSFDLPTRRAYAGSPAPLGVRASSFFCPTCPAAGLGQAPYQVWLWYFAAYDAAGNKVGLWGPFKNTYSEGLDKLHAMYQLAVTKYGLGARVCAAYQDYFHGSTFTNICEDASGTHSAPSSSTAPPPLPPAPTPAPAQMLRRSTTVAPVAPRLPGMHRTMTTPLLAPRQHTIARPPVVLQGLGAEIASKPAKPLDLSSPAIMRELKTMMAMIDSALLASKSEGWYNDPAWAMEDWTAFKVIIQKLGQGTPLSKVSAHDVDGKAVSGLPAEGEVGFPNANGVEGLGDLVIAKGGLTPETRAQAFPNITAHFAKYSPPPGAGVIPPQIKQKIPVAMVAAAAGVAILLGVAIYKRKR
jgi:hypothetical protein